MKRSDKGGVLRKIRDHYLRDVLNRLSDLEKAVQVMVDSPSYRSDSGAGFNGSPGRKRIFRDLLAEFEFRHIVETGTYLGDTSGYMAETSTIPVLTCELNPSLYRLAKMRLAGIPSITLHNMDSRSFLLDLCGKAEITGNECFFYLDAHWGKDLPLREEISLIASRWERFVIMVDDFEVPWDEGYSHESYGTLKYINIRKLKENYDLRAYFPAAPSGGEAVPPIGCAVLSRNDDFGSRLKKVASLRIHEP